MKTQDEYIKNSSNCPVCNSSNTSGGPFDADAGYAYQEITCHDCDNYWYDIYTLTGFELQQ